MQFFDDSLHIQSTEALIGLRNKIQAILDDRADCVPVKVDRSVPNAIQAIIAIRSCTGMRLADCKNALDTGSYVMVPRKKAERFLEVLSYDQTMTPSQVADYIETGE